MTLAQEMEHLFASFFIKFRPNHSQPQFKTWKRVWSWIRTQPIFLLFYLLNWVPDTIIVVVKYGSNEHVHPISLGGIFLHQCSLEVTPYSWDRRVGESGNKVTNREGCENGMGADGTYRKAMKYISKIISTGWAWLLYSQNQGNNRIQGMWRKL